MVWEYNVVGMQCTQVHYRPLSLDSVGMWQDIVACAQHHSYCMQVYSWHIRTTVAFYLTWNIIIFMAAIYMTKNVPKVTMYLLLCT